MTTDSDFTIVIVHFKLRRDTIEKAKWEIVLFFITIAFMFLNAFLVSFLNGAFQLNTGTKIKKRDCVK